MRQLLYSFLVLLGASLLSETLARKVPGGREYGFLKHVKSGLFVVIKNGELTFQKQGPVKKLGQSVFRFYPGDGNDRWYNINHHTITEFDGKILVGKLFNWRKWWLLKKNDNPKKFQFQQTDIGMGKIFNIKHVESGQCVHPKGGTAREGGKLVLWNECGKAKRIQFVFDKYVYGMCTDPKVCER